jgi:tetratricopeptide (TPR) repeat protein
MSNCLISHIVFWFDFKYFPKFDSYYRIGIVYSKLKQYKKSLDAYQKAISINNLIAEVYFGIGRTYEIMAQYQKAIDSYQIAALVFLPSIS